MICTEFEKQWSELDDITRLPALLQEHRGACQRCSQLFGDLTGILRAARGMRLEEEPPQRVWAALRNELEIEGIIRDSSREPGPTRLPSARGWLFRLPMGLAYASVFFMALGVTYLYNRSANPGQTPPRLVATAPASAPAASAPANEVAANRAVIADRDKKVEELLAKVPEDRRATLEQNWHQVNTAVANLSSFAATHPDDPFAMQQLMSAEQQKQQIWESLVQWDEF